MFTLHAELTAADDAGRQQIVLVAGGSDDEVATAAKRLEALTPLFTKSNPPGALLVGLSWAGVVQLAKTFGPAWCPRPALQAWVAEQTALRTGALPVVTPADLATALDVPDGLVPRDYQVAGAHEIARTGRALIFDEPRTGKTITTILGLALRSGPARLRGLPILVICPASVVDPWVEAFTRWAPYWTTVAWRGTPAKRRELAGTADVYVTSYDTARMDASEMPGPSPAGAIKAPLVALGAHSLVIDESHYIKNATAHRTRAVRRLARDSAGRGGALVALSGTPITHHPADLWPALDCLAPGAWPSRERWVNRFCDVLAGDYKDEILGLAAHAEPEFRLSILGQHRRVARADVMSQLPPKVYSVRTVDLPGKWRKAYDAMESQMLAELPDGTEMSVMGVLAQLTRLAQLASSPAEVHEEATGDIDGAGMPIVHTKVTLLAPSWKVDALLEILAERPGESVVAFAPSAQLMRLAGEAAAAAGVKVGYVIGGQKPAERTEAIRAFQAGELDLICATTGAGGTGITLSRAGTLVFLQRPWSIVDSLQAEDRAEGDMNSTRGTEVIDVVARNTIDTRVRAVLRERAGQLAELVQDPRIVTQLLGGSGVSRAAAASPRDASTPSSSVSASAGPMAQVTDIDTRRAS